MQRYNNNAQDKLGNALIGATVTVTVVANPPGSGAIASLFSDTLGTLAIGNPTFTDAQGMFGFCVADGFYDITVSGVGVQTIVLPNVRVEDYLTVSTSKLSASSGASLVGFQDSIANSVATNLSAYLNLRVKGLKATFGAVGDGTTDDTTKIANAAASGKIIEIESGTYKNTSLITLARYTQFVGWGDQSIINCTGAGIALTASNNTLQDFRLVGTGNANEGINISGFSARNSLKRVYVRAFDRNLRLAAALWTTLDECWFQAGNYGVDFKAAGTDFSTTVDFLNCVFLDNVKNGVGATAVPHVNQGINFFGGNIQNNGSDATSPQMQLGLINGFKVDGMYFENSNAVINIDAASMNGGEFSGNFMQGGTIGIQATSAALLNTEIHGNYFSALTGANTLNITGATNVNAWSNQKSAATTNILTGTNCLDADTNPIAGRYTTQGTFTPTLIGSSTAGTQTYTTQAGSYNQIGNQVFFRGRVSISAKDAAIAGNVLIGGLPITSIADTQAFAIVDLEFSGITFSGGYTQLMGDISSAGATQIGIQQVGSGVGVLALPVSGLAAATTIRFSGVYTVAG